MRYAWLAALLAGCGAQIANGADAGGNHGGKGDGDGSGSGGSLTPSAFLTKLGNGECEKAFACRGSFPQTGSRHFDDEWGSSVDECYAAAADYFMPGAVEADVAAGKIHFDAGAARSCLIGIDFGSCNQFWQQGPQFPSACSVALQGTLDEGADCDNDFECAGDTVCDPNAYTCEPATRQDTPRSRVALPQAVATR